MTGLRIGFARHRFLLMILAVTLAAGLVLPGCGAKNAGDQGGKEKILKVGVLGPYTGPASRVGEEFKNAATMAFETVNYKIGDYKIQPVWIDEQSDPEKTVRAYEEAAMRDEIQAGILNWHSSDAVAAMDVVAKYKIPHFFGFGATEVVNQKYAADPQKYSYWMGKTWPSPAKLSVAYVISLEDAIKKGAFNPKEKKAAIYGEDTDWGRSFGKALKGDLEKAGWKVVGEEFFAVGETEFYPLLKKLKDMNVSVIGGTVASAPSFAAFIKQAREVNLNSLIIADGLGWVGEWYQLTGNASDYVLDQIPQWTSPAAKEFKKKFEERWGFAPSPSAGGLAYDQTMFFLKLAKTAYEQYGKLDRETLYKVGQEQLWAGKLSFTEGIIMEKYEYTKDSIPDPVVGQGSFIFPVIQYFGGEGKIIWPEVWKEAEIKVPDTLK